MRHLDAAEAFVAPVGEAAIARGGELAAAVERHHGAFVERRGEEGARLVREMVLDEMPAPMLAFLRGVEALAQMVRRSVDQLAFRVLHICERERLPWRSPRLLGWKSAGLEGKRDLLVLEEQRRVVRVSNMVDVGELDAGRCQAIVDGVERQLPHREGQRALAVLDSREALLLRGCDHTAVLDEARRWIMERGVEAEGDHAAPSNSTAAAATASGGTPRRHS